jgi:carboxypeptidase Taq
MKETLLKNYNQLLTKYRDLSIFSSAQSILGWDMLTKMPPKGISLRSQQLALLSGIGHRMATDPEIGLLLGRIEDDSDYDGLNESQKRNIHLIRKSYAEMVALPESLVTEMQKQSSLANNVWRQAKDANNWEMFRPELEKNIELVKKAAEILMKVKKTQTPYDALIDIYEPGMTTEHIVQLFDELKGPINTLVNKIRNSHRQSESQTVQITVPSEIQRKIAVALAEAIHYDVSSSHAGGRIDETEHPFTSGYYDDVRITTHYYENQFASSIFSILHEGGHALYEQDLNRDWIFQPLGTACSTGIHESQSRFIENIIGRSRQFWVYFLPKLKEIAGNSFPHIDLENFIRSINEVKPSKIRIQADEVTYNLHIMIRFNIEKDLLAEKVTANELPDIWNQSYLDYLGVKVENYAEGVMQDMHWAGGNFGYFPCYALGNIYDGHFLSKMNLDIPDWPQELARGNFQTIKEWLIKTVHSRGNLYGPGDLIKQATGQKLSVEPYLKYLDQKYAELL